MRGTRSGPVSLHSYNVAAAVVTGVAEPRRRLGVQLSAPLMEHAVQLLGRRACATLVLALERKARRGFLSRLVRYEREQLVILGVGADKRNAGVWKRDNFLVRVNVPHLQLICSSHQLHEARPKHVLLVGNRPPPPTTTVFLRLLPELARRSVDTAPSTNLAALHVVCAEIEALGEAYALS